MSGETFTWPTATAVVTLAACVFATIAYMNKCKRRTVPQSTESNALLTSKEFENSPHEFNDYNHDGTPADQNEDIVQLRFSQRLFQQMGKSSREINEEVTDRNILVESQASLEVSSIQQPTDAPTHGEKTPMKDNNTPTHDTPQAELSDDSADNVSKTATGIQERRMSTGEALGCTSPMRASRTSQSSESSWAATPESASEEDDIVLRVRHQLRACIGDEGAMEDCADILSAPEGGTLRSVSATHETLLSHRRSVSMESPSETANILPELQKMDGNVSEN